MVCSSAAWAPRRADKPELQALAYVFFKVQCGLEAGAAVSEVVRQHLQARPRQAGPAPPPGRRPGSRARARVQLTEECAADCLLAVTALGPDLAGVQACTLELPAHLLLRARPALFGSFRRFARCRELTGAPLLLLGEKRGAAPADLARLRGRLRQLAVADAAEYCEPVYAEFCEQAFAAAAALARSAGCAAAAERPLGCCMLCACTRTC